MNRALPCLAVAITSCLPEIACAEGFIAGSKVRLEARNFYYNGDYREGEAVSKREEWAQGFWLNVESGYTPGALGFGADVLAFAGYRLDSSPDRAGSGLLPTHASGRAAGEYTKAGYGLKAKLAHTTVRYGMSLPRYPVLQYNNSRLAPQTFQGLQLNSTDIDRLAISLAQFDKTITPDSTDLRAITLATKEGRYRATGVGSYYRLAGAAYAITPQLSASYFYGELGDVYRQHFLGLQYSAPLQNGTVTSEVRGFVSRDTGAAKAGEVDNRAYSAAVGYAMKNGHSLLAVYQAMRGATGFAYINNPYLPNYVKYNDFGSAGERSVQLRYGYDFAAVGVPGLSFFTAYIKGSGLKAAGAHTEWERDVDVTYAFQGRLKGLSLRLRQATFRSDELRDIDETRVIATYLFSAF